MLDTLNQTVQFLIERYGVTPDQLDAARLHSEDESIDLETALVALGAVPAGGLAIALARLKAPESHPDSHAA